MRVALLVQDSVHDLVKVGVLDGEVVLTSLNLYDADGLTADAGVIQALLEEHLEPTT